MGSLQDPNAILTELAYIEQKVCAITGKEPMQKMESIDLTRFKLQNMKEIEDLHKNDNAVEIKEIKQKKKNKDLISELESLI